jgi:hypothetical protein
MDDLEANALVGSHGPVMGNIMVESFFSTY